MSEKALPSEQTISWEGKDFLPQSFRFYLDSQASIALVCRLRTTRLRWNWGAEMVSVFSAPVFTAGKFHLFTCFNSVKRNGKGPCCIQKLHPENDLEVVQVHRHEAGRFRYRYSIRIYVRFSV